MLKRFDRQSYAPGKIGPSQFKGYQPGMHDLSHFGSFQIFSHCLNDDYNLSDRALSMPV
jgi:hypothetical protein